MRKINNKRGFSLVELLAVVVILGLLSAIGIVATNTLVDKAKNEKMDSQKNTITLSAQTYMQNNKNLVPKIIGESSIIKVSDLRMTKYLTEDIKNDKGESCMEKSYVRVYKLSNTEYTYTTFLYCGNEEVPEEEMVPSPIITAKFSDSSGVIKDDLLNNVNDAYLYIEINAATTDQISMYKSQGTPVVIDGYAFKIFVYKGSDKQEAYNSGSLSGGRKEKIIINKKLEDYIDVTGVTEVSIEVTAINTLGGITNTNTTVGEHDDKKTSSVYDDNVKPKCVKPDSPYDEGDWLNKSEYKLTKDQRKLTVGCDDGTGSGCIRNYFTMSWPNDDDEYGAEYVYIEVKDNAGNISEHNDECKFRVNVDIKTPEASVTAYVGDTVTSNSTNSLKDKITGKSILNKTISLNDSNTSAKIDTTDYDKLIANTTDTKWMNNENYPNGVIYKIDIKDNIRLDKWTWNTNAGYINSTKSGNYLKVSSNNPEATSGNIEQDEAHGKTEFHGSTNDTIYVRFLTEGMRYGIFTAYDKAGNKIEIKIAANLDRTPPPIPSDILAYQYNKVRTEGTSPSKTKYTFGNWINRYVQVKTANGQNRDDESEGVTLSGFWQFYYDARNNANNRVGTSDYATNALGQGVYDFKGSAAEVDGKNKIRFMGCDKAGNCSRWSLYKDVWIDITNPKCAVAKSITNGAESSYNWLGIGETARVTATCTDPTSTLASGCTVGSFHHDYNYQINTTSAGALGNSSGGSFTDAAGNSVNCPANQRIQIDYTRPSCSVSGGSSKWTNNQRVVTGTCSDSGGSGCVRNISHTYNYDIKTSSGGAAGNGAGGTVYDKADNSVACAANQTVKVDRTMPYVTVNPSPGVYNIDSPGTLDVTITCHDSLSGLSSQFEVDYSVSFRSPIGTFDIGKCCEDNAGNLMCDTRGPFSAKTYGRHEDCGIEEYFQCRTTLCGVELYQECSDSQCGRYVCGTQTMTAVPTQYAGSYTQKSNVNTCYNYHQSMCDSAYQGCSCRMTANDNCVCSYPTKCPSGYKVSGSKCVKSVNKYCNYTCRTEACGVELYRKCEHPACGVKLHKQCWHYGADCNCSAHKVKTY